MSIADVSNQSPQNINNMKELVQLHEAYHRRGLDVVAFPLAGRDADRGSAAGHVAAWRDKLGISFHVMQRVDLHGSQPHPVYSFLKQQGADIKGPFQTAFAVVSDGDRCIIHRFDGKPPRALRSYLERWLPDSTSDESDDHITGQEEPVETVTF